MTGKKETIFLYEKILVDNSFLVLIYGKVKIIKSEPIKGPYNFLRITLQDFKIIGKEGSTVCV